MSIQLAGRPSTDGLGVKRWTYRLNPSTVLYVFERPPAQARIPYMLRLDRGRATVETRYAAFRSQAIEKAQWMALRVDNGEV